MKFYLKHTFRSLRVSLPSFGFSYNLNSSFTLGSLAAFLRVKYGDKEATEIGCVSLVVTPEIDPMIAGMIMYMPIFVLVLVGIAILLGAIWSPWRSSDAFLWLKNHGQDPDLLQLVTPSFGDCLHYIQFIFLTGGLTLNYPGFYQPIASKFAWSALMISSGFLESSSGWGSAIDGIYVTHGDYGLEKLSQLIGIAEVKNIWTCMTIWLLGIIMLSSAIIQLGFFFRWANRRFFQTHEEDLREKNVPYSVGNLIRIVFNYFLLPIVALSMFQFVVASKTPLFKVALSVLLLSFVIGFTVWLLKFIILTTPKSLFFEDHRTILLYGSFYNTLSDDKIYYAPLPVIITFIRGIAIGAVQAFGIWQLVLLALCEVVTVLSIYGVQPYHSQSSMNAYQISFSATRLASLLLMISFEPFLGVPEGTKGWIGYSILFMHCIVLVIGFMLNAIQTIMEVGFRLVVTHDKRCQARSSFAQAICMQKLSRRIFPRFDFFSRRRQMSDFTMPELNERNASLLEKGRARSQSSSSTQGLLPSRSPSFDFMGSDYNESSQNRNGARYQNLIIQNEASASSFTEPTILSFDDLNKTPLTASTEVKHIDQYYRPPRFHRLKLERFTPTSRYVKSGISRQWSFRDPARNAYEQIDESPLKSGRNSILVGLSEPDDINRKPIADYTTREVDLFYKIRGSTPASDISGRWSRNSSTISISPVKSATGWIKWILGIKTKEQKKGFEVMRRPRLPPTARTLHRPCEETSEELDSI